MLFILFLGAMAVSGLQSLLYDNYPTVIYGVNCTGNETAIFDCPIHLMDKGTSYTQCEGNDAGVACQSK